MNGLPSCLKNYQVLAINVSRKNSTIALLTCSDLTASSFLRCKINMLSGVVVRV